MPARTPSPLAYLAKAVLTAVQGRNGLFLLVAFVVYRRFQSTVLSLRVRVGDSLRQYLGRSLMVLLPPARKQFSKEISKQVVTMRKRAHDIFDEFETVHTKIPETGLSTRELKTIVDQLAAVPQRHCESTHMSGGIYSYSYWSPEGTSSNNGRASGEHKGDDGDATSNNHSTSGSGNNAIGGAAASDRHDDHGDSDDDEEEAERDAPAAPNSPEEYDMLARKLKAIYTYSFEKSYLWNSLHGSEFGVGDFLSYQCVRMVADTYGAERDEVMGFVTSGGTESIMTAVRAYRDWGIENRGLAPGEGVILAGDSVHAAFTKGGMAYNIQVELLPMNEFDEFDLRAVRKAAKRLGNRLIAIVGSTPSYPLGSIDNIKELAKIAQSNGVGFHVDSCLGGFIVNFVDNADTQFLRIPGVTSLSCDTHKNGWAPKGSSVCVMKELPDRTHGSINLAFYAMYAIPGWSGGVYGTPNNAGSQHCTHALHAYLAMLAVGKTGYRKLANDVVATSRHMAQCVKQVPELRLLHSGDGLPRANVMAFELTPAFKKKWGGGAIYALAHEMSKRGVTLSALNGQRVHYCVTSRSAGDSKFIAHFNTALLEAMAATRVLAKKVMEGSGEQFAGDAGLYGTLDAAMEPSVAKGGVGKYIENYLFGLRGTEDAVKAYFYGSMDPYATHNVGGARR